MTKFLTKLANMIEKHRETEFERLSRRVWLQNAGLITAASSVVWACGSDDDKAGADEKPTTAAENPVADGDLINIALGLEHEAIALYTAASKLTIWTTKEAVLAIAGSFLDHHKAHRDTLVGALTDLRAKDAKVAAAAAASSDDTYVDAAVKAGAKLDSVKGVLRLASQKEAAAAKAYISVIKQFTSKALAEYSGLHAGDEAAHYGALRAALFVIESDTETIPTADKVIPASTPNGF